MLQHLHPKFSVITVTYNAGAVIEDTIQSVITQTYKNIEYIIVDGASTDKTMSIVNRYRDRIHTVVSEPDRGLYDAMNKGIRLATHLEDDSINPTLLQRIQLMGQISLHLVTAHTLELTVDNLNPRTSEFTFGHCLVLRTSYQERQHQEE